MRPPPPSCLFGVCITAVLIGAAPITSLRFRTAAQGLYPGIRSIAYIFNLSIISQDLGQSPRCVSPSTDPRGGMSGGGGGEIIQRGSCLWPELNRREMEKSVKAYEKEHARLFFRDLTKAYLFKDKDKVPGLQASLRHAREKKWAQDLDIRGQRASGCACERRCLARKVQGAGGGWQAGPASQTDLICV